MKKTEWTEEEIKLLGTMSDDDLGWKLECYPSSVRHKRIALKIQRFESNNS